ncbi:uncharacterized protein CMU_028760 [Cryptosporidium muris RN66]|uniref:U3 small nucleolar RNA-associated protein 14 n=1 Tax=Cryptosporidium muris (strain RN66) TaxID=441375 RepID=B6AHW1_CRYMR|nr:uncharacterized protein CMU_028760 [Cryptosporidium muris RN66]EEA07802.1 hypothetical protein, conserved [Cryptosporidium muris RN66]|eukprot:XP_002142151.1 hypothetical protein [Cryptosporidium muris RN66]
MDSDDETNDYMSDNNTDDDGEYKGDVSKLISKIIGTKSTNYDRTKNVVGIIRESSSVEHSELNGKIWNNDIDQLNIREAVSTIVSNLSRSPETSDALKQISTLKEKSKYKIMELLAPSKQSEIERKTQYQLVSKNMKRWGPVIERLNKQEIQVFGKQVKIEDNSISQLSTKYTPMDEFEKEFEEVLSSSINDSTSSENLDINNKRKKDNRKLSDLIEPCDKMKTQAERNFLKRLKFLLFQQQKENKRLKKIKSKTWRKAHRRQQEIEEEKLLSLGELEYPELVKQIKARYEEKRAKLRLLRRQAARQKWAKTATRFGGRDMQKNIANQAQLEHDEKHRIEQIINSGVNYGDNSEDNNSDLEINEILDSYSHEKDDDKFISKTKHFVEESKKNIVQLKSISENCLDLKFIRKGLESKFNDLINQSNTLENELEGYNSLFINEDVDKIPLLKEPSKPSAQEIIEAQARLAKILDNSSGFNLDMQSTEDYCTEPVSSIDISPYPTVKCINTSTSNCSNSKQKEKCTGSLDIQEELQRMVIVDQAELLNDNSEVMKQIFIYGNYSEVDERKDSTEELVKPNQKSSGKTDSKSDTSKVPGWGDWCCSVNTLNNFKNAEGFTDISMVTDVTSNTLSSKKPLISINNSVDRKIAKYYVQETPHPYKSAELYESTLKYPIGPEWNTTAIHNRLIQPKIQSRIGAVIKPLVYSKQLKNIPISDSFLKKWSNLKKCNRTKARF